MTKNNKNIKASKKKKNNPIKSKTEYPEDDDQGAEGGSGQKRNSEKNNSEEDEHKIDGLLDMLGAANSIEKDADLDISDNDSMKFHNNQYDALLQAYVEKTKRTFDFKLHYAELFLSSVLEALRVILAMFMICIFACAFGNMDKLSLILPVCVSFLAAYIVIPQIITKYLFNEKEEQYMSEIIKNIQNFDKAVRRDLKLKKHREITQKNVSKDGAASVSEDMESTMGKSL